MRTHDALWFSLLALTVVACSARRLPAGTPPPEYEPPILPVWSPAGATAAGPVEPSDPVPAPDGVSDGGAGPELSLDAAPR